MTDHDTGGCRYIIGELKADEPWRYCGETLQAGSSYCPPHHAACYYRLRRRRRDRDDLISAGYLADIIDDAA